MGTSTSSSNLQQCLSAVVVCKGFSLWHDETGDNPDSRLCFKLAWLGEGSCQSSLATRTFSQARVKALKSLRFQLVKPSWSSFSFSAISSSLKGCGSSGAGANWACTTSSDAPCKTELRAQAMISAENGRVIAQSASALMSLSICAMSSSQPSGSGARWSCTRSPGMPCKTELRAQAIAFLFLFLPFH